MILIHAFYMALVWGLVSVAYYLGLGASIFAGSAIYLGALFLGSRWNPETPVTGSDETPWGSV